MPPGKRKSHGRTAGMMALIASAAFADPQPQSDQSRVRRLALSLCPLAFRVSEKLQCRKLSFLEPLEPEAQFPRISLLKLSDKWLEGFPTVVDGWREGTK